MSLVMTILLIGLLSARELLRVYYGQDAQLPQWSRWLNYGTLLALATFLVIIVMKIFSLFTTP